MPRVLWVIFFKDAATTEIYTLSLHDALPISSIVTLSGDVHHAYLAEVAYPRGSGVRSAVWQAVCSPFRNPLDSKERRGVSAACSQAANAVGRARSEEHTSELQSRQYLVCRLLLEKK